MRAVSPETRACLDYAFRQVVCIGVEDEQYVCRDGITIVTRSGVERIELSGSGALIHLVAKAMQAHLRGVDFTQARNDLIAANVGKVLADKVHDHLSGCSVGEWQRLRERVAFYMADDNTALSADPSTDQGTT